MNYNKSIKSPSQMDAYRSVRKPAIPQNNVERPDKGGGYKRHEKFRKSWNDND